MFENFPLGCFARYVYSPSINQNNQKRFSPKICNFFLISSLVAFFLFPSSALATQGFSCDGTIQPCVCLGLYSQNKLLYSVTTSNYYASPYNPPIEDYCLSQASNFAGYHPGDLVAVGSHLNSEELNSQLNSAFPISLASGKASCSADSSTTSFPVETLINILPSSPPQMRLPTIIANLAGDGSLASNLVLELYSAVWEYLAIFVSFKMFRFFVGR